MFHTAEFLDCGSHKLISSSDKLEVFENYLPKLVPLSATVLKRSTTQSRRLLNEEKGFLQFETSTSESPLLRKSKMNMTFLKECTDDDPLEFWTRNDQRFPILASVARVKFFPFLLLCLC